MRAIGTCRRKRSRRGGRAARARGHAESYAASGADTDDPDTVSTVEHLTVAKDISEKFGLTFEAGKARGRIHQAQRGEAAAFQAWWGRPSARSVVRLLETDRRAVEQFGAESILLQPKVREVFTDALQRVGKDPASFGL